MAHQIIDHQWFEITAFILSIVSGIGLVLFLEHKPKASRLDTDIKPLLQYKQWRRDNEK